MFSSQPIRGSSLSEGQLCFTFDDGPGAMSRPEGPGPRTLDLARFMSEAEVPCTFFMSGRHVAQHPGVVDAVVALGHTVGNHSENHWDFDRREEFDLASEVRTTFQRLRAQGVPEPMPFRAPYGHLPEVCAKLLNAESDLREGHYGPIHWDVDASDWEFWQRRLPAGTCAEAYLDAIREARQGIVIMHDSSADITDLQLGNRTLECIKTLVPQLKAFGMSFVGLMAAIGFVPDSNDSGWAANGF